MRAPGMPLAESNKQAVRRLVEDLWNQGDAGAIDRHFAAPLRETVRSHHAQIMQAFSDVRVEIEDPGLVAEGDLVAARLTVHGRHDRGPFAGRPPTGRRVAWESVRLYRLRDGEVVETWAMQDRLGLLEQLGAVTAPAGVDWAAGGRGSDDDAP